MSLVDWLNITYRRSPSMPKPLKPPVLIVELDPILSKGDPVICFDATRDRSISCSVLLYLGRGLNGEHVCQQHVYTQTCDFVVPATEDNLRLALSSNATYRLVPARRKRHA